MCKAREWTRAIAGVCAILLLLGTVISFLLPEKDPNSGTEGTPPATDSARDPWLSVSADGVATVDASECLKYKELVIPQTINGVPVTGFETDLENPAKWVESITLPSSLRHMGEYPLHRWDGLQEIVILEGIEDLSNVWFGTKPNLKKLVIPASVTALREGTLNETPETLVVHYGGTEEAWLAMGNAAKEISEKYTVIFESDGVENEENEGNEGADAENLAP